MKQIESARIYLRNTITLLKRRGQTKLPTLTYMSKNAQLSHVTLLKAINECKKEGLIESRKGSGIYLAGTVALNQQKSTLRWEKVKHQIIRDIYRAKISANTRVESLNQFALQYNTTRGTLKKVLHSLEKDGFTVEEKGSYLFLPTTSRAAYRPHIIMLVRNFAKGIRDSNGPFSSYHTFEYECAQKRIAIRKIQFEYRETNLVLSQEEDTIFLRQAHKYNLIGIIIGQGLSHLNISDFITQYGFEHIQCAYEYALDTDLVKYKHIPPNVHIITPTATEESGYEVAKHLIAYGHSSVCFISQNPNESWSQKRFSGITRAFNDAGYGNQLSYQVIPKNANSKEGVKTIISNYKKMRQEVLDNPDKYDKHFSTVIKTAYPYSVLTPISYGTNMEYMKERLDDFLEYLLIRPNITAVIADRDPLAIALLSRLKALHIKIPHDYSVISFDDSMGAFTHGLTSYNFNFLGLLKGFLNFFLYYDRIRSRHQVKEYLQPNGFLVERSSTGPARKQ